MRLWRTLAGFRVSKDIQVYSRDEVEYWRASLNHVLAWALRKARCSMSDPKQASLLLGTPSRRLWVESESRFEK